MSLRSRLLGAIGVVLVLLLTAVVVLYLYTERQRYAKAVEWHATALRFAASMAGSRSTDLVEDSGLFVGQDLDPRLSALVVFAEDPELGGLTVRARYGEGAWDDGTIERATSLATVASRTGVAWDSDARGGGVRSGDAQGPDAAMAFQVQTRRPYAEAGKDVVYLELAPLGIDRWGSSQILYVSVVGAGLALLVAAWFIVERFAVTPLREVVLGANRVAEGDYSQLVPTSGGGDEIRKVIDSFNSMMLDLGELQGRLRDRIGAAVREARQTQDSLVIAQRLAATGRLAAGIAHEVNNPLAGMINAVIRLRTKEMPEPKREEYLELVEGGLYRIQQTVAKILQFTPHKVAPQPVDLADVVRPVVALSKHRIEESGAHLTVELAPSALVVFGDPYELQQALLNVVLNALDAILDADRERGELLIRLSADGQDAFLLVRDNGTGMSEEDRARAFDLFFTTKEPGRGSGLGLATVHKILSDHLGRVRLDPRDDGAEGTDVELVLPLLEE